MDGLKKEVINGIQERDRWVTDIYIDVKKPFKIVPHVRLIWKLKYERGL